MRRRTLNLGIVAHVDAGKTTLTERLLFAAGVIDEVGSVDRGTTRTDSLALERRRGITIKSAVVSFAIDDVVVNLIDTPGHPDFIAEVERVLAVLDGAVLVISAVEGVQPQTRILMRALQRLRIPTLIFINKVDRGGAEHGRVVTEIRRKLTPLAVAVTVPLGEGTKDAVVLPRAHGDDFTDALVEVLGQHDDALLAAYLADSTATSSLDLREKLAAQTKRCLAHPIFSGSAITGAGVALLMRGIAELLPAAVGDVDGEPSGLVFKIERGRAGERIALVRMFSGTVHVRDRVHFGQSGSGKVTAITVFGEGTEVQSSAVGAGEIGKLWGLGAVEIGDSVGPSTTRTIQHEFPPPTLESVVEPADPRDRHRLRLALAELSEQDPLINVRQDDLRQEVSISLYGEVQKEVIQATLADEYAIDVTFRETTPVYVERPVSAGEAVEVVHTDSNPFHATIGLRVEPAPDGSGLKFRLRVDPRTVPLYVYKTIEGFTERMDEYVRSTMAEGLFGWQVTDCVVTMFRCGYTVADGPPSRRGPTTTAGDFRKLTPIVVMRALESAGTVVCEPVVAARLEVPRETLATVLGRLARDAAAIEAPLIGEFAVVEAVLPVARLRDLQRQLPELTGGEGVVESSFAGYRPVAGAPPTRPRTTANPLNLNDYLNDLSGVAR